MQDALCALRGQQVPPRASGEAVAVARPYPVQYVEPWTMKDGTGVIIRPIRPEDEPLMVRFHEALSERTVYLRYFQASKLSSRVTHERLARICLVDYDREIALVADLSTAGTATTANTAGHQILAVARLSKLPDGNAAEIAILVRDTYQRRGLGAELLRRLIRVARDEHIASLWAYILQENLEMQALVKKMGFHLTSTSDPATVAGVLTL